MYSKTNIVLKTVNILLNCSHLLLALFQWFGQDYPTPYASHLKKYLYVYFHHWLHCGTWSFEVMCRLRCPMACGVLVPLSSPTRDQMPLSCIGRQILNYWTTREVPCLPLIDKVSRDSDLGSNLSEKFKVQLGVQWEYLMKLKLGQFQLSLTFSPEREPDRRLNRKWGKSTSSRYLEMLRKM